MPQRAVSSTLPLFAAFRLNAFRVASQLVSIHTPNANIAMPVYCFQVRVERKSGRVDKVRGEETSPDAKEDTATIVVRVLNVSTRILYDPTIYGGEYERYTKPSIH